VSLIVHWLLFIFGIFVLSRALDVTGTLFIDIESVTMPARGSDI
jgi:hypothetical protein